MSSSGQWQVPPSLPETRRNAVLRIFDSPLYADWAFWWTAFWVIFTASAIGFSDRPGDLPPLVNGLLAGAFFGLVLGWPPAFFRLRLRRLRAKRHFASRSASLAAPSTGDQPARVTTPGAEPTRDDVAAGASRVHGPTERFASPANSTSPDDEAPSPEARQAAAAKPKHAPAGAPPPTQVDVLSLESLASSSVLKSARSAMPFPVARAIRMTQLAADRRAQYDGIIEASEALTLTLGITAAAWMRTRGISNEALLELQQSFKGSGVSQGRWLGVIRETSEALGQGVEPIYGLRAALRRGKRGSGLVSDLEILLQERNRWAHGARPRNLVEAGVRALELGPVLERAVERAAFLSNGAWVLTESSSYGRDQNFSVSASTVMGDHPEFERMRFVSTGPLIDQTFYLLSGEGPIDLTPYVVMRYCDTCRQREICHADKLDRTHGVALRSFVSGHVIFDRSLVADVEALTAPGEFPSTG